MFGLCLQVSLCEEQLSKTDRKVLISDLSVQLLFLFISIFKFFSILVCMFCFVFPFALGCNNVWGGDNGIGTCLELLMTLTALNFFSIPSFWDLQNKCSLFPLRSLSLFLFLFTDFYRKLGWNGITRLWSVIVYEMRWAKDPKLKRRTEKNENNWLVKTNISVVEISIRCCSYSSLDLWGLHVVLFKGAVLRNLSTFKHRQPPQNWV